MSAPPPAFRTIRLGLLVSILSACSLRESVVPGPVPSFRPTVSTRAGASALHGLRADVQVVLRHVSEALQDESADQRVVASGQFQLQVVDSGEVTAVVLAAPQHLPEERVSPTVARLFRWERVKSIRFGAGKHGITAELTDGRSIRLNDPRALLGQGLPDASAKAPATRIPELSASTIRQLLSYVAQNVDSKQAVGSERTESGAEGSSARWRTIAPGLDVITSRTLRGGYAAGSKALEMELSVVRPQIVGGEP